MELLAKALREGRPVDVAELMAGVPFCEFLGLKASLRGDDVVLEMPFDPKLVGNPIIPALHGGVIGSFLETAAIAQAIFSTRAVKIPKPVDFTVDYLRTGRAVTSYAKARLARQGRRVVNVHAEMWQEDEARPIATLRGHFLLAGS
jgi:uncharacterized protein (TIGR00369 family)